MIDLKEFDEQFIVRYDESKTCMFAYLWAKEDWECYKDGAPGLWEGDFGWISVSAAFARMKVKHYHFYPAGSYRKTYISAYQLNEVLGNAANATDDRIALFLEGEKNKQPLVYLDTIGEIIDTKLEYVNRERKLANYLLGYLTEDDITDNDSTTGDKKVLMKVLERTKDKIADLI